MNARELIEKLQSFDPKMPILSDGADIGKYDVERGLNIEVAEVEIDQRNATERVPAGRYIYVRHVNCE